MGGRKLGSVAAATVAPRTTPPDEIPIEVAAEALGLLLERPVDRSGVVARAVGLGLLRLAEAGEVPKLSLKGLARLLLAGYGLPVSPFTGGVADLCRQVRLRQRVVAFLTAEVADEPNPPRALRIHGLRRVKAGQGGPVLLVSFPDDGQRRTISADVLRAGGAGGLFLAGYSSWDELPAHGTAFLGGHRWPGGELHWHVAECDTDEHGRVLRY